MKVHIQHPYLPYRINAVGKHGDFCLVELKEPNTQRKYLKKKSYKNSMYVRVLHTKTGVTVCDLFNIKDANRLAKWMAFYDSKNEPATHHVIQNIRFVDFTKEAEESRAHLAEAFKDLVFRVASVTGYPSDAQTKNLVFKSEPEYER